MLLVLQPVGMQVSTNLVHGIKTQIHCVSVVLHQPRHLHVLRLLLARHVHRLIIHLQLVLLVLQRVGLQASINLVHGVKTQIQHASAGLLHLQPHPLVLRLLLVVRREIMFLQLVLRVLQRVGLQVSINLVHGVKTQIQHASAGLLHLPLHPLVLRLLFVLLVTIVFGLQVAWHQQLVVKLEYKLLHERPQTTVLTIALNLLLPLYQ